MGDGQSNCLIEFTSKCSQYDVLVCTVREPLQMNDFCVGGHPNQRLNHLEFNYCAPLLASLKVPAFPKSISSYSLPCEVSDCNQVIPRITDQKAPSPPLIGHCLLSSEPPYSSPGIQISLVWCHHHERVTPESISKRVVHSPLTHCPGED